LISPKEGYVSDPYLGEIQAFPYAWAVSSGFSQKWLPCLGQTLTIQQYSYLFSLIGTLYGGDGRVNFQLPNLNGMITNSQGTGLGIRTRNIGQRIGSNTVALEPNELALHTHALQMGSRTAQGAQAGPGANMVAIDPTFNGFVAPPSDNTTFGATAMTITGSGQSHDNTQPTQAIVWCICVNGIFPSFPSA
jgi:microcystin-dependent protein